MPLYRINVFDGHRILIDREGVRLRDRASLSGYVAADARDLLAQGLVPPSRIGEWRLEAVDEAGRPVLTLPLSEAAGGTARVH